MRILHFSQSLLGGPATYFEEIALSQIEVFGKQNILFVVPETDRHLIPSIPDECLLGFPFTKRDPYSLARLALFLERVVGNFGPDLVHLHSTYAGVIGRAPLLLNRRDYGVVYCAHGWSFNRQSGPIVSSLCTCVEQLLARVTSRIINISEAEQASAILHKLPTSKMTVIVNGINGEIPEVTPEVTSDRSVINLLFVGRHDPQKGLDILLKAVNRVGDRTRLHLHVLGTPVVSSGVDASASLKHVTFHGWKSREEVFQFMAAADALLVPSRWEGFGIVALEAMRMGKPVIASNRGALPEIVVDRETGLIFDLDSESELDSILCSLDHSKLQEMGAASQKRFQHHFTSDRMNRELIELYEETYKIRGSR
jgi:glycosyltransferase involved in cell wall biosynthesis